MSAEGTMSTSLVRPTIPANIDANGQDISHLGDKRAQYGFQLFKDAPRIICLPHDRSPIGYQFSVSAIYEINKSEEFVFTAIKFHGAEIIEQTCCIVRTSHNNFEVVVDPQPTFRGRSICFAFLPENYELSPIEKPDFDKLAPNTHTRIKEYKSHNNIQKEKIQELFETFAQASAPLGRLVTDYLFLS